MKEILTQLEKSLPGGMIEAIRMLGELAAARGEGLYLVGGAVRDLLLGGAAPDMDLVVEGDAVAFAFSAAQRLGAKCEAHKTFGTATMELPGIEKGRIDFATARTETYKRPGALPNVSPAKTIIEDLSRRDFTINAMAASLVPPDAGKIIDPHGGLEDLEAGILRVLHPGSFTDDPTRILRGLRFRARLGFEFDHETLSLMGRALSEECFNTVSGARIRKEIRAALEEPCRAAIISELNRLDIAGALVPGLTFCMALIEPEDRIAAAMTALAGAPQPLRAQPWVTYLLAAIVGNDGETLEALARRIALSKKEAAPLFDQSAHSQAARAQLEDPHTTPEEFEELVTAAQDETLILLHAADEDGLIRRRIEEYVLSSRGVRLEISGADLLSMGHEPSAIFAQVLREVRRHKIQGKVKNRKQELALARKLLDRWD